MYKIKTIEINTHYCEDTFCTNVYLKNNITFPCIKNNIDCIEDFTICPYITHSEIIKNLSNTMPTNNRILITGYISTTLLYSSTTPYKSICSNTFKIPFKIYINLNNQSNMDISKYVTNATVKNTCLNTIKNNSIYQSFDLSVYACPILLPPTPPPIKKLQNAIKINSINNTEVAKIEFDATNQKFLVTIMDEIPNPREGAQEYFVIFLRNVNTQRVILRTQIIANETPNIFFVDLNDFKFTLNDNFLQLDYLNPSKVTITNFPQNGTNHTPIIQREFYRITPQGLTDFVPPIP